MTSTAASESAGDEPITPRTAKWLAALGLLPVLGLLLFATAGVLGLRAFSHNNSLGCGIDASAVGAGGCGHYSYAVPVLVGVAGLLLLIGGGAFASYYAMRNVGLPLVAALRQRAGQPRS